MGTRRRLRAALRSLRRWLNEGEESHAPSHAPEIPFDNRYDWLNQSFLKLIQIHNRPEYIWGMLQGVALGKVLGMDRVSVIEFGVAGGAGLIAMEQIADEIQRMLTIGVDVYGFDSGTGIPKSQDHRDCPNIWLDGQFPMDRAELEKRLRRASLKLGLVGNTVPEFIKTSPAPVAFVSFDLDLYSSTRDALKLLEVDEGLLLPRVLCYFDDIMGLTYGDYNGERLAIAEFNTNHTTRKLTPLYGLKFFVPPQYANKLWTESFYFFHIFDHPLYNYPDELRKPMIIDSEGNARDYTLTSNLSQSNS